MRRVRWMPSCRAGFEGKDMKIRRLDRKEHGETRSLYEEVFCEDSKGFVDYYYTEKTKDNQIYVLEEGGAIRSMLHLNPYVLMVNGTRKQSHYIVAVATQKEYRKRGYMAAVLKKALRDLYAAGESFTFLMPAAEKIYLPYDFRTVYEQERQYFAEGSETSAYAAAKESDCESLAEAANVYLGRKYQVFALRDSDYYKRLIKEYRSEGGELMIRREDGKITGCLPYVPDEGEGEEKPKIMVRIVDVRRMLMSMSLRSLMAVCFRIVDPVIEENNRCIVATGTEFSGLMLMEGKPGNSEGTITVAALASLLFGAETIEKVCREEGVVMSERMKEELRKIIPLSEICLNEIV